MLKFDVITIFPDIFKGFVEESLLARGQAKKLIKINLHNLRKWANDKHQTVDDRPFGGGPGMVMKVEPIMKAVKAVSSKTSKKTKVILFSPRGKKFNQEMAKKWAKLDQVVFICGRYEGVDERVADYLADEVVSIGDYVLNGGEVAAMIVMEAVSRLVPGFIAKKESAEKFDHAQFTRPEQLVIGKKKISVPKVLLSGDHKKIEEWRDGHK
ncbi:MAG: tRNA (guanosine(37)-N1)-methyltransferase TrmD [bacterium]|nr:tRNA (guanosine(37)-N1)-methyltransferase TrmD [bacterium]